MGSRQRQIFGRRAASPNIGSDPKLISEKLEVYFVSVLFRIVLFVSLLAAISVAAFAQPGWKVTRVAADGDLVAVYFTSSEHGFVAGDNGYLASTNDGGRTWQPHELNTTQNINEIYFRNENNGYIVAGRQLFITSDAGETWNETVILNKGDLETGTPEFLSIRFSDKKRGHAVGSILNRNGEVIDSLVMRTTDGGETWHRLRMPSRTELFHLDFAGSSNGWIVGDKGVILVTHDGGETWSEQRSGTERALYNVDFRDKKEGYAVGGRGTILRTENGGETWRIVPTSFPETFMRVDFTDSKNGWIVGHKGTVLRSSDKGQTWVKQECDAENHIYGLYMSKKFGWAVGADGLLLEYQR